MVGGGVGTNLVEERTGALSVAGINRAGGDNRRYSTYPPTHTVTQKRRWNNTFCLFLLRVGQSGSHRVGPDSVVSTYAA